MSEQDSNICETCDGQCCDDGAWDDDEDEWPPYGQPGSIENPDIHIKWIVDGAASLAEVVEGLRAYATYCEELATAGWELTDAVDNSHGCVHWAGEGQPPVQDIDS